MKVRKSEKKAMVPKGDSMVSRTVLFVAEQLHFANALASNDPDKREKAMRRLRKYLQVKTTVGTSFSEDDFLRIWKGLFYCMWMSDKPLIQEGLAEEISGLVHVIPRVDKTFLFIKGFFVTIMNEWYGIDYHRLEKFSMFVRRFLRQSLFYCKGRKWNSKIVAEFTNVLRSTILSIKENRKEKFDVSLVLHFVEIFLEELAKAGEGKLPCETLLAILDPFVPNLSKHVDERIQNAIKTKIFYGLIEQTPEAVEYDEKMKAWRRAGYPGKSWKDMIFVAKGEKRSHREHNVAMKHLDPRAGGVHVFLPNIKFDPIKVAELLEFHIEQCDNKTLIQKMIANFQKLAQGEFPFAKNIPKSWIKDKNLRISKKVITEAAEELYWFQGKIKTTSKPVELKKTVAKKQTKRKVDNKKSTGTKKNLKQDQSSASKNKENLPHLEFEVFDSKEIEENSTTDANASTKKKKKKSLTKGQRRAQRKERKRVLRIPQCEEEFSEEETNPTDGEISSEEPKIVSSGSGDFKEFYVFKGLFSGYKNQNIKKENNISVRENREVLKAKRRLKNRALPEFSHEKKLGNLSNTDDERVSMNNSTLEMSKSTNDSHEGNPGNLSNTQDSFLEMSDNFKDLHEENTESLSNTHDSTLEMSNKNENTPKSILYCEESKICAEEDLPELTKIIEPSPASNKKVNIVLQKNKSQAMSEYLESVKQSPNVPHDGSKKPFKGVLKRSSIQSPINPFYKPPKMQKKGRISFEWT